MQAGAQTLTAAWEASSGLLPDGSACPAFTGVDSASPEDPVLSATELTLATSAPTEDMFYMQTADLLPVDPLVVEARVRFVSGTGTANRGPAAIALTTSSNTGALFFIENDAIFLTAAGDVRGDSAVVETHDAHTYRVTITGAGAVAVDVDGVPTLTGSTYTSAEAFGDTPRILWGEGSNAASGSHAWEFVRHNASDCGVPGSTTTSTTTVGGSTTSTTLATCVGTPGTPEDVQCRLDALTARVASETGLGKMQAKLQKILDKANARLAAATAACAEGNAGKTDKQLKKAERLLGKFGRRLRSRSAQKKIEASLRESLATDGDAARMAVTALRSSIDCQAGAAG